MVPQGDTARQAVASLRGYVYQALVTTLAWLDIEENGRIYLEVVEDYASVVDKALKAVQVKDTKGSGPVTLNSESVRNAITAFVDHAKKNPDHSVDLHFWTTSEIGKEKAVTDRPVGMAGLEYWKQVADGADPAPLRAILESDRFPDSVRKFSESLDNECLRRQLIEKIRWNCGKPDFSILEQELKARLIVVGRDVFRLPNPEASRLVNPLVYQVLKKSILDNSRERVLTRADLYCAIDAATQISMPYSADRGVFSLFASELMKSGSVDTHNRLFIEETNWLVDGTTLPEPQKMIGRPDLESAITNALGSFGITILAGSSGLGKSIVSRAIARAQGSFFMVDFQNTSENDAGARLDSIFARIGGLPPGTLILEDLNHLDNPTISLSLARVIDALRRRNRKVIVSCHQKPSLKALTTVGLDEGCIVECPYFSEEEVSALVARHGGQPESWGHLSHRAGGFGHPQLTHAFVTGMAARGWPIDEIAKFFSQGLSSEDTEAARDAARQNLLTGLPKGTRILLYRLSLTFNFHRSMALTIGEILPPISKIGERLDQLIGPWVETIGQDRFRVSPLVTGSGAKMLSSDNIRHIHETIAIKMLANSTIDVSDMDVIWVHASAGKSAFCLTRLAQTVLSANLRTVAQIAEHMLFFRFLRTDAPIFPENPLVSAMLRVVQFKLEVATSPQNNISRIVDTLFDEISTIPEGESKLVLEYTALTTVLSTMGIANHLDNWVGLLLRFENRVQTSEYLQSLVVKVERANGADSATFFSGLFSIGSANLVGVDRLERIIDQLDNIDSTRRASLLSPIDRTQSDYSTFINGPWANQRHCEDFDPEDAALRYGRMAKKTRNWDIHLLSIQCSAAQAVMLDEYLNNREGALMILEEAVKKMGTNPILGRAMFKVYWHQEEHHKAFEIFRGIENKIGVESPVDRAFAFREAAIIAAECREWSQAEKWFLQARDAARLVQSENMEVMAIGLGADSAVAALECDNPGQALTQFAEALEALANINPESTLCAAYCHRVIRHTVLWARSRIERSGIRIGGQPIQIKAGTCSNPEPLSAIRKLPLAHIDCTWYMLAEIEVVAGLDKGISTTFRSRLEQGLIPVLEVALSWKTMQSSIDRFDAVRFSNDFAWYLEISVWLRKADKCLVENFDSLAPQRGQVPKLELLRPFDDDVEQAARDAVLAYAVHAGLANRPKEMTELEIALGKKFTGLFPGKMVFDDLNGNTEIHGKLDKAVKNIIGVLFRDEHLTPKDFWLAGLRLFEWTRQSRFCDLLVPKLAVWQRSGWTGILANQRFNLVSPIRTVPPIEDTLKMSEDDKGFVAKLLLATSDAVGLSLAPEYRNALRSIAENEPSPSNQPLNLRSST